MAASDWKVVVGFVAEHIGRVQYNSDREGRQLLSCDGHVEAQHLVSTEVAHALQ